MRVFQCTYEYGAESCAAAGRLGGDEVSQRLSDRLQEAWTQLRAAAQEHITRLRVAAVFHRTADEVIWSSVTRQDLCRTSGTTHGRERTFV